MAAGILVRSSSWLNGKLPLQLENTGVESVRIFCAVSSVSC